MNIYKGGFGAYEKIVAAKNEEAAIKEIQKDPYLAVLPVKVEKIEVEGYDIVVKPKK